MTSSYGPRLGHEHGVLGRLGYEDRLNASAAAAVRCGGMFDSWDGPGIATFWVAIAARE
jgi:hypothetical protein